MSFLIAACQPGPAVSVASWLPTTPFEAGLPCPFPAFIYPSCLPLLSYSSLKYKEQQQFLYSFLLFIPLRVSWTGTGKSAFCFTNTLLEYIISVSQVTSPDSIKFLKHHQRKPQCVILLISQKHIKKIRNRWPLSPEARVIFMAQMTTSFRFWLDPQWLKIPSRMNFTALGNGRKENNIFPDLDLEDLKPPCFSDFRMATAAWVLPQEQN